MWKHREKLILCVGLVLLTFGLARLYYRLTDDFRLANMTYEIPHHPEWEIPALTTGEKQQLDQVLDQPFYYLRKGAQSYVFTSGDGKYVLKFFKFKHLKPSLFYRLLPPIYPFKSYVTKEEERKERVLNSVFIGHRLSYDLHKNETGLLFIHLNRTDNLQRSVTVYDKLGFAHTIDLDPIVFLVQEKGETLRTVMNTLLKTDQVDLAKQRVRQVFDLYLSEYHKGIYDHDHGVMHNVGFVGEKPIHLDVGKMTLDERLKEPSVYSADLRLIYAKIELWVRVHYPQYYEEIVKDMDAKFREVIGA